MKLVIEIPNSLYANLSKIEYGTNASKRLLDCIKNGKALPKGHGRLIEVTNQLEQELFTFTRYTGIDECPYESAILITDKAPTIIEADKENEE